MDFPAAFMASNDAAIEFLKIELSLANTFLDVADITKLTAQRLQSHQDTQKAYREVLRFLPHLQLSTRQRLDFDLQLSALKKRMLVAGIEL